MPAHTVDSISDKVFQNFPKLTPAQKDDILALLEELREKYGVDFFDAKMTVQNALRLTGLKYLTARDVLMDKTKENLHDILALHPLLKMQEEVFKKIDTLKDIQKSFPNYPETGLNDLGVITKVYEIADLTVKNRFQICSLESIGEMIKENPKLIYYFMD